MMSEGMRRSEAPVRACKPGRGFAVARPLSDHGRSAAPIPRRHPRRTRTILTLLALITVASVLGQLPTSGATFASTTSIQGDWGAGVISERPLNADGAVTCQDLNKTVDLWWDPVSAGSVADGYHIYRSTSAGGPYDYHAQVAGNQTDAYQETGLDLDSNDYYYVIRAAVLDTTWESDNSAEVHAPTC